VAGTGKKGTLLVTGGLGYTGSHTIVEILSSDAVKLYEKIVIVDDLSNSSEGVIDQIKKIQK
jgi:UDP-glucose 4-epimerase